MGLGEAAAELRGGVMALAAWAALCFVIALAGTWLARRYALRAALLDHPGERRSHAVPTPRGGGIAIVVAVLPVLVALGLRDEESRLLFAPVVAGLLLVAGIGWCDDHRPLPASLRLAVHAVAAALLAWALHAAGAGTPVAASGFVLALVLVNVWNFMDGIDGLAASQALVAALAYAMFAGIGSGAAVAWLGVALAACCAGFLPFNLPRARIFLGDVGSGALGYLLAVLAALSLQGADLSHAPLLLLPLLAFAVDASLTLGRRILRRERWWQPHTQHAYQAEARRRGHGPVTAGFFGWTFVASAFMLSLKPAPALVIMSATAMCFALACGAWWVLQAGGRMAGRSRRGSDA
jgi:UDP-N-acetylmuramyl pentapeptide phosphotransferase/UDP-N-acetylglucosamine-1-phosphate transferase